MAYKEATKLPELVPPMTSISMPLSSNAFKAPTCAIPLIPPPDKANPNFKLTPSLIISIYQSYEFKPKNDK